MSEEQLKHLMHYKGKMYFVMDFDVISDFELIDVFRDAIEKKRRDCSDSWRDRGESLSRLDLLIESLKDPCAAVMQADDEHKTLTMRIREEKKVIAKKERKLYKECFAILCIHLEKSGYADDDFAQCAINHKNGYLVKSAWKNLKLSVGQTYEKNLDTALEYLKQKDKGLEVPFEVISELKEVGLPDDWESRKKIWKLQRCLVDFCNKVLPHEFAVESRSQADYSSVGENEPRGGIRYRLKTPLVETGEN